MALRVMSMSDQFFDAFGDRVASDRVASRAEQGADNSSRFLARFGVTLFWVLALAIVSARILAGV
jgi:hypothetical protein